MKIYYYTNEQMILFKGSLSLKQYMPHKPHKYGYQVFVFCDFKGIIHNFKLCTGKISSPENLGASSIIVLKLAELIPSEKNFLMYFDNWFLSLPLMCCLAKRSTLCLRQIDFWDVIFCLIKI